MSILSDGGSVCPSQWEGRTDLFEPRSWRVYGSVVLKGGSCVTRIPQWFSTVKQREERIGILVSWLTAVDDAREERRGSAARFPGSFAWFGSEFTAIVSASSRGHCCSTGAVGRAAERRRGRRGGTGQGCRPRRCCALETSRHQRGLCPDVCLQHGGDGRGLRLGGREGNKRRSIVGVDA